MCSLQVIKKKKEVSFTVFLLRKESYHCVPLGWAFWASKRSWSINTSLLSSRNGTAKHENCMVSVKCGLFLFNTKVQPSCNRQWVTGMLIRFCRNCFIIIRFAAHSVFWEQSLVPDGRQTFIWLWRLTWGPRFEACHVGLGAVVTFHNGFTKDLSQAACHHNEFLDGEEEKPSIYLVTLI